MLYDSNPNDLYSSPGVGPIHPDFIVICPAPSAGRSNLNHPFGAKSVEYVQKFTKGSIYWTSLGKSAKEYGEKFKSKELVALTANLFDELNFIKGDNTRILVQGTDLGRLLCPGFSSLREDHGARFFNPELNCFVTATFPFAAISRDPTKRDMIENDLIRFFSNDYSVNAEFIFDYLPDPAGQVFLDIETTGVELYQDQVMMVGLATRTSKVCIFKDLTPEFYDLLFDFLSNCGVVIGHNFQFDLAFLNRAHPSKPWTSLKVHDTMIMAYVLGEEVLSLKHLTSMYTKRPGSHGSGGFEDPAYLAEDVISTKEVYDYFAPKANQQWITSLLCDLISRMVRMRELGVNIDWEKATELEAFYADKLQREELALQALGDINWNSGAQAASKFLEMGVPLTERTATGKLSVSEPNLRPFQNDYPIVNQVLSYKDLIKEAGWIKSYRELQVDGMLHPKLSLTGTSTGRLSCSDPNLQQVPRLGPIKQLFTSRYEGGFFGLIDLAQAELRVAALLSDDDLLAEALMSEDVHRYIASIVYELPKDEISSFQRKKSKGITFGLLYGGGASGLAERIGVPQAEVEKVIKVFYGQFKKLAHYLDDQMEIATTLFQSTTPLGRIRQLKNLALTEGEASIERKAKNTPIQGTASDIQLIIMNYVFTHIERNKLLSLPLFAIHDSSEYDIHPQEVTQMVDLVRGGFKALNSTPLSGFPLWGKLPIQGELILAQSWAGVESTNEGYNPLQTFECSNL
jgi:DNA polymerase I-like protein with 3'-5' exonuclease and polymerase domains